MFCLFNLGAAVQELRHGVDVACPGSGVERVKMLLEQRDDFIMTPILCCVQRCPSLLVRPINVRAFFKQEPRRIDAAGLAGDGQ